MPKGTRSVCSVEGCEQLAAGRGLCKSHHHRWMKYGNPVEPDHRYGPQSARHTEAITAALRSSDAPRRASLDAWDRRRSETGTQLGYFGRHQRVRAARGPAKTYACAQCGQPAHHWSQIHDTSGEDPMHYRPMCRSCHLLYDDVNARGKETLGPEGRSALAVKAWSHRSPEERRAILKKAWVTRRANLAASHRTTGGSD